MVCVNVLSCVNVLINEGLIAAGVFLGREGIRAKAPSKPWGALARHIAGHGRGGNEMFKKTGMLRAEYQRLGHAAV
jgi:hypothetical protein